MSIRSLLLIVTAFGLGVGAEAAHAEECLHYYWETHKPITVSGTMRSVLDFYCPPPLGSLVDWTEESCEGPQKVETLVLDLDKPICVTNGTGPIKIAHSNVTSLLIGEFAHVDFLKELWDAAAKDPTAHFTVT